MKHVPSKWPATTRWVLSHAAIGAVLGFIYLVCWILGVRF